jgi:hypothetical protein
MNFFISFQKVFYQAQLLVSSPRQPREYDQNVDLSNQQSFRHSLRFAPNRR